LQKRRTAGKLLLPAVVYTASASDVDMPAGRRPAVAAALVVVIVMVMVMFASMPPMIVVPVPAVVVIVPVVPEPMEVLPGKVDISRSVPALIEHWLPVVETIPRAGADEYAVDKIVRSPVTIRSAAERIVRVVSVRARRGDVVVAVVPTDMDTD
jgi:hypothetical protein